MSLSKNRQPLFRDTLQVYDAYGRVIAEYGASASDVKAEFIWAIPPAANDNSPFGLIDRKADDAALFLDTMFRDVAILDNLNHSSGILILGKSIRTTL